MDYLLDVHCHTVSSGHAYSTVKEYIDCAAKKGLRLIAITDHAPEIPGAPKEVYFRNLDAIKRTINGVEILSGVELNILNTSGDVDLHKGVLKKLDVVIASLHTLCFEPLSMAENTMAVINAMKNPFIQIIGHLGDPRYPVDIKAVVNAAKETKTIIELNDASLNPIGFRAGGEQIVAELIKACKELELPVLLSSDAHFCDDIGHFEFAKEIIKSVELPKELILNTSIDFFKNEISRKK